MTPGVLCDRDHRTHRDARRSLRANATGMIRRGCGLPSRIPRAQLATAVLCVLMAAACGSVRSPEVASPLPAATAAPAAATTAALEAGTTHEAVLVAPDYRPPKGRVDSTGAYIPANGKPTLVFVDAIW